MDEYYNKWKKALDDFKASVDKDVKEIRKCKAMVQAMKHHDIDRFCRGQYIRNNDRIIISAPEIIIGNVNKEGVLYGNGGSTVVIRANNISEEAAANATGVSGRILQRATRIDNVCVDPGMDGCEATVDGVSAFTVHAASIGMVSENTKGVFVDTPVVGMPGEICIKADRDISLKAALPGKNRKKDIENIIKAKKARLDNIKKQADEQKDLSEKMMDQLDKYLNAKKEIYDTERNVRGNYLDINLLHDAIEDTAETLGLAMDECTRAISRLAELNRQLKCLEEAKEAIAKYADNYEKVNTGANVTIMAENTNIISQDADGNIRDTDGAGLYVQGRNVTFSAHKDKGATMEKSRFSVTAHDVALSTANPTFSTEAAEYPTAGNVCITSKNITLESVDYEWKDKKRKEKALSKDGKLDIRVENIDITSYATDGKSGGKFALNSKDITLRAVDMKVDDSGKASDDKLAEGSRVAVIASDITVGGIDKEKLGKSVKLAFAEDISADAKTKLTMQQDEGQKAAMTMAGGKTDMKGDSVTIAGTTTVDGETTINKKTSIKAATSISASVTVSGTIDTSVSKGL